MRTEQKLSKSSGIVKILLFGSALVTLTFWTKFADPFNPLKLTLILAIALWLTGHLVIDRKKLISSNELRYLLILISILILGLVISTLNSSVQQVAWVGDYQRNNGLLFYLGLCIILVGTALYFKEDDLSLVSNLTYVLGLVISIYGLFQINGIDFVQWSNPYNAIISTVGNPNFAGAILATMGVLSLGFAFSYFNDLRRFILNLILFCVILITIFLSEARQGLIGIVLGCSFVIGVWIHSKSKILGRLFFLVSCFTGFMAVLGMLQIGPLSHFLYKGSVTIRGYYWRAGIEMFMAHPWFGVGSDYYGGYFKQYREVGYPLNYGYEITSTNAHNVFIQIFSTTGVFAGTAYLLLILYIFWRGIQGLRRRPLNKRIQLATIFGAWLTLQSISVISIDSPGIAIWSWILGGIILALTSKSREIDNSTKKGNSSSSILKSNPKQTLLSSFLLIPLLLFSINVFKVESSVFLARQIYNPNVEENGKYLQTYIPNLVQNSFINSTLMTELASFLATSGYAADGIEVLNTAISRDPRNQDAINLLASYYFELKQPEKALKLRLRIIELDPYNAKNYYQLGVIYKTLGDFTSMEKMQKMILSFAKDTPEGVAALKDLVP
jgi:O-antigen ligase